MAMKNYFAPAFVIWGLLHLDGATAGDLGSCNRRSAAVCCVYYGGVEEEVSEGLSSIFFECSRACGCDGSLPNFRECQCNCENCCRSCTWVTPPSTTTTLTTTTTTTWTNTTTTDTTSTATTTTDPTSLLCGQLGQPECTGAVVCTAEEQATTTTTAPLATTNAPEAGITTRRVKKDQSCGVSGENTWLMTADDPLDQDGKFYREVGIYPSTAEKCAAMVLAFCAPKDGNPERCSQHHFTYGDGDDSDRNCAWVESGNACETNADLRNGGAATAGTSVYEILTHGSTPEIYCAGSDDLAAASNTIRDCRLIAKAINAKGVDGVSLNEACWEYEAGIFFLGVTDQSTCQQTINGLNGLDGVSGITCDPWRGRFKLELDSSSACPAVAAKLNAWLQNVDTLYDTPPPGSGFYGHSNFSGTSVINCSSLPTIRIAGVMTAPESGWDGQSTHFLNCPQYTAPSADLIAAGGITLSDESTWEVEVKQEGWIRTTRTPTSSLPQGGTFNVDISWTLPDGLDICSKLDDASTSCSVSGGSMSGNRDVEDEKDQGTVESLFDGITGTGGWYPKPGETLTYDAPPGGICFLQTARLYARIDSSGVKVLRVTGSKGAVDLASTASALKGGEGWVDVTSAGSPITKIEWTRESKDSFGLSLSEIDLVSLVLPDIASVTKDCVCADDHVATANRLGCVATAVPPQSSNTGPQCPSLMEYPSPIYPLLDNITGTFQCRQGYQCPSTRGTIIHIALIADGFPDCADGSDETAESAAAKDLYVNVTLDGVLPELPKLTEEQEELLDAVVAITTSILPDVEALVGKLAVLLIILTTVGVVIIISTVVAERMAESSRLDATSDKAGSAPCWAASSSKAALAKIWHCIWEFKAAPIIVYSFYAMLLSVSEIASTQQLSPVCLPDPSVPRWDTERQCNLNEPSCMYVEKDLGPSICHRSLKASGRSRLLHHMQGITEQINTGNAADIPNCGCLIPGESGLDGLVGSIVLPCTVVLAVGLAAAIAVAIFSSKLWRYNFGTIEYFLSVADCRRVGMYIAVLVTNVAVVLISFFVVIKQVEFDRREGNLTQKQYDSVYVALFVGYLLQFLAFGNLWSHKPPSTALKRYMKKCKLEPVGLHHDTPANVAKIDLKWTWYLTADDVLANAENGFLFYALAELERLKAPHGIDDSEINYENWVPTVDGDGKGSTQTSRSRMAVQPEMQPGSKMGQWLKSATSCTVQDVPKLKKVDHQEQQPGNFEQRYLAQKLGTAYWTGGLALCFVDSSETHSLNAVHQTVIPKVTIQPKSKEQRYRAPQARSVPVAKSNEPTKATGTTGNHSTQPYSVTDERDPSYLGNSANVKNNMFQLEKPLNNVGGISPAGIIDVGHLAGKARESYSGFGSGSSDEEL